MKFHNQLNFNMKVAQKNPIFCSASKRDILTYLVYWNMHQMQNFRARELPFTNKLDKRQQ